MRQLFNIYLFFFLGVVVGQQLKSKSAWNRETADQRLDDIITVEFKARDANKDNLVTSQEIRDFYEAHPEKMSKAGLEFIDRNFNSGKPVDADEYRKLIKKWLAENGSVERILTGVFGNHTKHLKTHNVRKTTTTLAPE